MQRLYTVGPFFGKQLKANNSIFCVELITDENNYHTFLFIFTTALFK